MPSSDTQVTVHVAGFWRRFLSGTIDALFLIPILLFLYWIAFKVSGLGSLSLSTLSPDGLLEIILEGGAVNLSLLAFGVFIVIFYHFFFTLLAGASPGLRLFHLRVINIYGDFPEWWRALIRSSSWVLGGLLLGLGWFWIGFDREKRGLHDWLAGTYVIRNRWEE